MRISVVLPAKNEAEGLARTLPTLREQWPQAEVIVVDDGSTDATARVAAEHGARVLSSPYSMGNGAAMRPINRRQTPRRACIRRPWAARRNSATWHIC